MTGIQLSQVSLWRLRLYSLICVWLFGSIPSLLAQAPADSLSLLQFILDFESAGKASFSFEARQIEGIHVSATLRQEKDLASLCHKLEKQGLLAMRYGDSGIMLARKPTEWQGFVSLRILGESGSLPLSTAQCCNGRGWVADSLGVLLLPKSALEKGVEFRCVGYESLRLAPGTILPDQSSIRLKPALLNASEVDIVVRPLPQKPLLPIYFEADKPWLNQAARLEAEVLEQRGAWTLAGVTQSLDGGASPRIRGAASWESLIELDGLPLYQIDHYFHTFSPLDIGLVDEMFVHRNHIPADRGGIRGGLVEVESLLGEESAGQLAVNTLGTSVGGRFRKNGHSLLVQGRKSFGNLSEGRFSQSSEIQLAELRSTRFAGIEGTPNYDFGDLYGGYSYNSPNDRFSLEINGFRSDDNYNLLNIFKNQLKIRDRDAGTFDGVYYELKDWNTRAFQAKMGYRIGKNRLELQAFESRYDQELNASAGFLLSTLAGRELRSGFQNLLRNEIVDQTIGLSFREEKSRARGHYGLQYQSLGSEAFFETGQELSLDESQAVTRIHAFGSRKWQLGSAFELDLGLRISHALEIDQNWLSPRVGLGYSLGENEFLASYSHTQQAFRRFDQENQYGQTYSLFLAQADDFPTATSDQLSLGWRLLRRNFSAGIEAYHRWLDNEVANLSQQIGLPLGAELVSLQPNFLFVIGEGRHYGVDMDWAYSFDGWQTRLAYTLSRSERRFERIANGIWYRGPEDQRHRLAGSLEKRLGAWEFSGQAEWASGFRFVDLSLLPDDRRSRLTADPDTYLASLPDYQRIDLAAAYHWNLGKFRFEAGLRLFNLLDRENIVQRQYVAGIGLGGSDQRAEPIQTDVTLPGRQWVFELRISR